MANRRDFLKTGALLGLAGLSGSITGNNRLDELEKASVFLSGGKVTLPPLPYPYEALEPFIDRQTMQIHHGKHHQAYIDKLNTADPGEIDLGADMADNCRKVTEKTSALVRNNLGGHYNHQLFWQLMKPNGKPENNLPQGDLANAINKQFGSFADFKKEFSEKAGKIFGSGWCWLIEDEKKNLVITTTPNQDNPLMKIAQQQGKPVLGLDIWEHAYYLKYQNKRADYISAWWNVVNWDKVAELFTSK